MIQIPKNPQGPSQSGFPNNDPIGKMGGHSIKPMNLNGLIGNVPVANPDKMGSVSFKASLQGPSKSSQLAEAVINALRS